MNWLYSQSSLTSTILSHTGLGGREVLIRIIAAGHWRDGDPEPLPAEGSWRDFFYRELCAFPAISTYVVVSALTPAMSSCLP